MSGHAQGSAASQPAAFTCLTLPEILDEVFSHLHLPPAWDRGDDKRDLLVCHLVNKQWNTIAHRHIFHAVHLRFCYFRHETFTQPQSPLPSLYDFYDFLQSSESPMPRTIITKLTLTWAAPPEGGQNRYVPCELLASVLQQLPNLKHLVLDAFAVRTPHYRVHPLDPPLSLHTLVIDHGIPVLEPKLLRHGFQGVPWCYETTDVANAIGLFAHVGRLSLCGMTLPADIYPEEDVKTSVGAVEISTDSLGGDELIVRTLDTTDLTSLRLPAYRRCKSWGGFEHLAEDMEGDLLVARGVGGRLRELGFYWEVDPQKRCPPQTPITHPCGVAAWPAALGPLLIDPAFCNGLVQLCPHLDTLTLLFTHDSASTRSQEEFRARNAAQWTLVAELFLNFPRPVRNIVFDVGGVWDVVRSKHPFEGAETEMRRVEETLEGRYASLGAAPPVVHVRSREARDLAYAEKKAVRACFPASHAAGRLRL